ncbi:MAG: alpha/beta fold hydrolase [Bacteroidales bacterium]|nr:alpha/beta fold hydrolase [Bacteroidales bacterium]
MRGILIGLWLSVLACLSLSAKEHQVYGPQGALSMKLSLPDGFDQKQDTCSMVLLMHGIFSSKDYNPMLALAKALAEKGIASIRFDFNGHGKSEGRLQDMTVEKEIADAMAMWEFANSLPYVSSVGLLGHSQGGVVASMTAGRLAAKGELPIGVVLLAPGSVIKDACRGGAFFNARFDPANPPEYVTCFGTMRLGREYLLSTQTLDIFGTSACYEGPVRLIHGDKDEIVSLRCSRQYLEVYGDNAELMVVEGENHMISKKLDEVKGLVVDFFVSLQAQ